MTRTKHGLWLLGLFAALALGCASKSSSVLEPEATAKAGKPAKPHHEMKVRAAAPPPFEPIYFDTDTAVLRPEARAELKARAEAIRKHPEWGVVTVQGHCDERGSGEYNLALGERRAMAVKRYLVDLGVPASRLETVSYGESQPAVLGHDETAWRFNRRTELASDAVQSARR